ncbi:hypothetical protein LTR56_012693 [Elasticomyces elasticus]|nr:hypothetical protein LTR22_022674 [Elasticomyces elasticus]KAK3638970.1 hypothetical protein LTR56_012693 [Elasticomyces elasticus]KAK4918777.1 hypothetical protein LTR49_013564 [Elasticomyces elasticus]KAK5754395.1 hypothetical protein LTS12_015464 [Elasticomyces elasticus]
MPNAVDAVTRTQTRPDVNPVLKVLQGSSAQNRYHRGDAFTALYFAYFEQRRLSFAQIQCMHAELGEHHVYSTDHTDPNKIQTMFEMACNSDMLWVK